MNAVDATSSFMESGGNLINANLLKEVVLPFVTNVPVVMEMQSPLVDKTNAVNTDVGSYPPLPTQGTTPIGNIPGKSSYAKVIGESSRKAVNFHTLFTMRGNGVDVVVNAWGKFGLVKSMLNSSNGLFSFQFSSMDGLNSMLENGPWFIRNHPLILQWEFKPHKEYRPVPKKATANSRSNKKKGVEPTNEISNSNPFDVLNSVDNDMEDSYGNGDYDDDPYDDDMYEGRDISEEIQTICDNLDIRVRGRKKK
ncbi:zinc finger, CCHC-type containing protein [Tanacetum coccineum]